MGCHHGFHLSPEGFEVALQCGERLKSLTQDCENVAVVSSPLLRARETAEMIIVGLAGDSDGRNEMTTRQRAQSLIGRSRALRYDDNLIEVNIREQGQAFTSIQEQVESGAVYEHGDTRFDSLNDVAGRVKKFVKKFPNQ